MRQKMIDVESVLVVGGPVCVGYGDNFCTPVCHFLGHHRPNITESLNDDPCPRKL